MGESFQQERESPWALTLTDPAPEAFEFSPSDWPEKYFSGQSAKRSSRATLMSSYTRFVFLIDRRSSVAHSTGTFLRRASQKIIINKRSRGNRKLTWPQENKHSQGIFHGGLIEGIANF